MKLPLSNGTKPGGPALTARPPAWRIRSSVCI